MAVKEILLGLAGSDCVLSRREVRTGECFRIRTAWRSNQEELYLQDTDQGIVWIKTRLENGDLVDKIHTETPPEVTWPSVLPFLRHRVIIDEVEFHNSRRENRID